MTEIMTMASLHKDPRGKSPYWYCAFYLPDGRRAFRSTKEKKHGDALKICLGWEKAAQGGRANTLTEAQVRRVLSDILENATGSQVQFYTSRSWLDEWVSNREGTASGTTMQRYRQVTRDFLEFLGDRANLTLAAVTPTQIREFRDHLKKGGRTEATVNNVVKKVLNVPFAAAHKLGYIPINPVESVDSYKIKGGSSRHPFTTTQLLALIHAAKDTEWEGMVLAGYFTGLRLSNLAHLKWGDVDLENQVIKVRTVKTDTPVAVPLHHNLYVWLVKQTRGIGQAPVFPRLQNCGIGGSGGLSAQFRKLLVKSGISGKETAKAGKEGRKRYSLSFHSLRHSFVSALLSQGVSSEIRKKLAGHSDDNVHEIYSHHEVETLRHAVQSLPSIAVAATG